MKGKSRHRTVAGERRGLTEGFNDLQIHTRFSMMGNLGDDPESLSTKQLCESSLVLTLWLTFQRERRSSESTQNMLHWSPYSPLNV